MSYLLSAVFFLLGLIAGKLCNLLADVTTAEEGTRGPTASCRKCGAGRLVAAMIPLAGFLRTASGCSRCGEKIPWRVPVVELCSGIIFAFLWVRYGWSAELPVLIIFCSIFMTLFITDLEHTLLPDSITYTGMAIALVIAALITASRMQPLWAYRFASTGLLSWLNIYIVNVALAGLCGFLLFLLIALAARAVYRQERDAMGFGDVKLAGLMGLAMGLPTLVTALFIGVVGGGLVAAILLLTGVKKRGDALPFGPFLCLASIAALLWGKQMLSWYLSLV
jgi:leader peptidase (prepilin peptidase)/N-methyltransferase